MKPKGWEESRIKGMYTRDLDEFYKLVVEDRGADRAPYWKKNDERVRVYALKFCGSVYPIKYFPRLKGALAFCRGIDAENWRTARYS